MKDTECEKLMIEIVGVMVEGFVQKSQPLKVWKNDNKLLNAIDADVNRPNQRVQRAMLRTAETLWSIVKSDLKVLEIMTQTDKSKGIEHFELQAIHNARKAVRRIKHAENRKNKLLMPCK